MTNWDELRDRALAADIREALANDRRLPPLDLSIEVRGGVAHLFGEVGCDAERLLVQRIVGRLRGIHAVWDLLRTATDEPPRVIDLGCGGRTQWGRAIGVDRVQRPAVAVLADLERALPFAEESIDLVFAVHVLEHVRDLLPLMNEIHRVLRPGGRLHVLVPHWQNVVAIADPTHVRFFGPQTFEYFCHPEPGTRAFRPLLISASVDTVFADLEPVKDGTPPADDDLIARFFR